MNETRDDLVHCFVCGGETPPDINLVLYSRKQKNEKLPYFPFLEFHEPAPNAEPMASDSSIQGCVVCYSYLKTQWNHFVRSKTQINKRLYWLKRPAGCEIRQPVNIIELEEILSEQAREEEEKSDSEDEGISTSLPKKDDEVKSSPKQAAAPVPASPTSQHMDTTPKATCCYLCSIPTPKDNMQRISLEKNQFTVKQLPEVPVFTVLSKHKAPRGAVLDGPHSTLVCPNCFTDLCRKYPPEEHLTTAELESTDSQANEIKCYMCLAELINPPDAKILYAKQVRKGEAYFPFLNHIQPLDDKDVIMPKLYGYTYACKSCYGTLYKQYTIYEKERMPQVKRKYTEQIQKCRGSKRVTPSPKTTGDISAVDNDTKKKLECYICARDLNTKYKVYTHPGGTEAEDRPFFPAIANIIPATRTQQLNSHASGGAAFVCKVCHANLQHQWSQYEQGGQLPNLNRWLRPYNVQEVLCGSCSSTVPTGNTVEADESTVTKIDSNAIKYDGKVIICTECESTSNSADEKPAEQKSPEKAAATGSAFQQNALTNPLLTPELLTAQLAMQQAQYPLMNPYLNLFPSNTFNAYTAQLAAALSQQVKNQTLLKTKRTLDPADSDEKEQEATSSTAKQARLSEMDMAAKIQELEAKYESLKNNSMKLAAAVIKSEKVPDEAKSIINEIEKN